MTSPAKSPAAITAKQRAFSAQDVIVDEFVDLRSGGTVVTLRRMTSATVMPLSASCLNDELLRRLADASVPQEEADEQQPEPAERPDQNM